MYINSTKTKSTHTGSSRMSIGQPRSSFCIDIQRRLSQIYFVSRLVDINGRRQDLVVQSQNSFDESSSSSSSLGVAYLRFDSTQSNMLFVLIISTKHHSHRGQFTGISCIGSSTMSFYQAYSFSFKTSFFISSIHSHSLTRRSRSINRLKTPIRGSSYSFYYSINGISISFSIF